MKTKSIKWKITLYGIVLFLVFLAAAGYIYRYARNDWSERVDDAMLSAARLISLTVEERIGQTESMLLAFTVACSLVAAQDNLTTSAQFESILWTHFRLNAHYDLISLFVATERDGSIYYIQRNATGNALALVPGKDYDARRRTWYNEAIEAGKAVVNTPFSDYFSGEIQLSMSAPFAENAAGPVGVAGCDIDLFGKDDGYLNAYLQEGVHLLITTADGTVVAFRGKALDLPEEILARAGGKSIQRAKLHPAFLAQEEQILPVNRNRLNWRIYNVPTKHDMRVILVCSGKLIRASVLREVLPVVAINLFFLLLPLLLFYPVLGRTIDLAKNMRAVAGKMRGETGGAGGHIQGKVAFKDVLGELANLVRKSEGEEVKRFWSNIMSSVEMLDQQRGKIVAYARDVETLNEELEKSSTRLRMRNEIWERTLEVSKMMTDLDNYKNDLVTLCTAVRRFSGAVGVTIVANRTNDEKSQLEYVAVSWDPKSRIAPSKEPDILLQQAFRSLVPVWRGERESRSTRLFFPLYNFRMMGILELVFDRRMKRDEELVETLTPVVSSITGCISVLSLQHKIRTSYYELAEKLFLASTGYENSIHKADKAYLYIVSKCSRLLAAWWGKSQVEQDDIEVFSRLQNIGELRISPEILNKSENLTREEWQIVKRHPQWGAEMIGEAKWLAMCRNICLTHHEKWDGSGYPNRLAEDEIPWEGQVVGLADIYAALRLERPYRNALTHEQAVDVILNGQGNIDPAHFNPSILRLFVKKHMELNEVFTKWKLMSDAMLGEDEGHVY